MTKTLKGLTAAVALLSAGSLFANIDVFNRSLPNQAGVSFDYVVDTWDFNTVAGYYAQAKGDNFSMTYGASELDGTEDTGEAAVSGRLTVGLPIFYAVAQRNSSTSVKGDTAQVIGSGYELSPIGSNYTETAESKTSNNTRTTVQLGTAFGNLGVALFADLVNNSTEAEKYVKNYDDTTDSNGAPLIDVNIDSKTDTATQNKFGINLGQSTEDFASAWTLGAAYTMLDDTTENKMGTTTTKGNAGYDFDGDGTIDVYGVGTIIDIATTGWMPLGADFWGWSASFSMLNSQTEKGAVVTDKVEKYSGMDYSVNPFYTKTLAIKDGSNLYLNPGIAVSGSSLTMTEQKTTTSNMNVDFTLPIMFQVPVTESGSFTVQAGVSPSVALYHTGTVIDVDGKKTTSTAATDGLFATSDLYYGFGASYKPTEKLSMHALFDTKSANEVSPVFAFGVDYHFGAAATVQE